MPLTFSVLCPDIDEEDIIKGRFRKIQNFQNVLYSEIFLILVICFDYFTKADIFVSVSRIWVFVRIAACNCLYCAVMGAGKTKLALFVFPFGNAVFQINVSDRKAI